MLTSYYAIPFATNFPPAVVRTDLVAVGLLNQAAAYSASYDLIHQFDPEAQVGFALNMYSWRGGDPTNPGDQQTAADFSDFYNRWFPDAVLRGEVDANFDGVITADEIHPELAGKADYAEELTDLQLDQVAKNPKTRVTSFASTRSAFLADAARKVIEWHPI